MSNTTNNTIRPITSNRSEATLHLMQSSRYAKRLAKLLLVLLVVSILAMMFLPWQQTSRGTGSVVAYAPQERQQTIDAPAKGVVGEIGRDSDGNILVEGSEVKKGDVILTIQPFAANKVEQLKGQLKELKIKEGTLAFKAEAQLQLVEGYTEAKDFAVSAAEAMVEAAKAKLESKQELLPGYDAKQKQARQNFERQDSLARQGLKPAKEIEKLRKEWDVAKSDVESIKQDILSLKNELLSKRDQVEEKRRLGQAKVDYAQAMYQDALGGAATTRKEAGEVGMKLGETDRLVVKAPRDGTIYRMPLYELGQAVKEGEALLTLIPDSTQNAVELMINGNDLPFVQLKQEVRLQFEGWPSVQVAGWPSTAVGTFEGQVASIDNTDNGKGEYRILVIPSDDPELEWPEDSKRFLRQGVRANGWVQLRKVRLGYEIWRQMNGFPVEIEGKEIKQSKRSKPPKVPK